MAKAQRNSGSASSNKFTPERLEAFARDVKSQRVPLERQQISDDVMVGLRAMIHKTGLITFSASYYIGDKRGHIKIGDFNKDSQDYISIEDAREVTKTIKALGEKGIDVQDGLQRRLIRELKDKGTSWRVPK
jgi:hypothetical protein